MQRRLIALALAIATTLAGATTAVATHDRTVVTATTLDQVKVARASHADVVIHHDIPPNNAWHTVEGMNLVINVPVTGGKRLLMITFHSGDSPTPSFNPELITVHARITVNGVPVIENLPSSGPVLAAFATNGPRAAGNYNVQMEVSVDGFYCTTPSSCEESPFNPPLTVSWHAPWELAVERVKI